jgi:membrane fusion protein (multidrug efflux system)
MNVPTQIEEALNTNNEKTNHKAGDASNTAAAAPVASAGRRLRVVKILVLLAILAGAGVGAKQLWGYFDSYESTDDAQIEGHLNGISSRISGTVTAVHFENNQRVAAGEVLVELDPRDYRVSLEQAKASLGLAASQLTAERPNVPITQTSNESVVATSEANISHADAAVAQAERDYDSALADLRQAEANNTRAQADEARYRGLVEKDEISRTLYDQKGCQSRRGGSGI